jgi:hypothetical protein
VRSIRKDLSIVSLKAELSLRAECAPHYIHKNEVIQNPLHFFIDAFDVASHPNIVEPAGIEQRWSKRAPAVSDCQSAHPFGRSEIRDLRNLPRCLVQAARR